MKHKFFHNRFDLWDCLKEECKGLDFNRTLQLPIMYFSDGEKDFACGNMVEFVNSLNSRFGTKYSPTHSYRNGQKVVMFYDVDDSKENKPLIEANKPVEKDETIDIVRENIEVGVEGSVVSSVDWGMINSLKNNAEDKLVLDKYAEDNFGIALKRNKRLEGMIEDFKAALEDI